MNNLSNTSRLKRMGILDIIAAIFLVIMGAMLLNVEVNAKYSASEAIIEALQFLIALGVILIPLGILLIVNASRRTAATRTAASIYAWMVTVGSAVYTLFQWINHVPFAFFGLFGLVLSIPALVLLPRSK